MPKVLPPIDVRQRPGVASLGHERTARPAASLAMEIEERRVDIDQLAPGMYVSRLDRPWAETDFPLQGFRIDSQADIQRLGQRCRHVYIDVQKSVRGEAVTPLQRLGYESVRHRGQALPPPRSYADTVALTEELPAARRAFEDAHALAAGFVADVRAGRRLSPAALNAAIEPIVASVVRNADAFHWLNALRKRDAYSYSHAVNCCALAASFGRHLGFPRDMLVDLASAGMLMDIGKTALPQEMLSRPGPLAAIEWPLVESHVSAGLRMLGESGIDQPEIVAMIRAHHERHDGSGYPSQLSGSLIPLPGRMLGLIDTFDALCSERPHQPAMSRHDALQWLYRQRDRLFQAELIEQFSQSLGVYPTGTLVQLSTGEVAMVMAQNPSRRLYPRVTVLTRPDKSLDPAFRQVDLWLLANTQGNTRVVIERALPPGAHGLNVSELYL